MFSVYSSKALKVIFFVAFKKKTKTTVIQIILCVWKQFNDHVAPLIFAVLQSVSLKEKKKSTKGQLINQHDMRQFVQAKKYLFGNYIQMYFAV